jgi:alanyl aminopeptidase
MKRLLPLLVACGSQPSAPPAAPGPIESGPAGTAAAAPAAEVLKPPGLRLGDAAQPLRYEVDLTLVPGKDTFTGVVRIDLDLRAETSAIVLNGRDLTVESASLAVGDRSMVLRAVAMPPEWIGFQLPRPVAPGRARLQIAYRGLLERGESDGVYQETEGKENYIYTQFEASDARRAFPSFDEPRFKVPWTLTLHVPSEHLAFANTPVVSEKEEPGGLKAVRFAESKPMPSYLVAFAVGPFDVVDAGVAGRNKTPIRIITPRGKAAEARWAAQSTGPILEVLEAYFDSPYPFEKLDSIAVPQKSGAMENPGLVTYGTGLILGRPGEDSVSRRRRYASVCAHELAHMWFGDLVTMVWWDDIWLNEAFATWMARRTLDTWKPEWKGEATRVADRSKAMDADSLISARQIRQPIKTQDDIEMAFDGITYGKGAAVIVMFERWLGREVFQRGVRRYMKAHAWGNATAADFLAAISAEAGRDVAPAFSTFLDQPGVPLVEVGLTCARGAAPVVSLAQKRYLPTGSTGSADQLWQVPVCVDHPGGTECTLLTEARAELPLKGRCPAWIQANGDMNGYYRVTYTRELWKRVMAAEKRFSLPERVGILGDLRALASTGLIPYGEALALMPPRLQNADRQIVSAAAAIVKGASRDLVSDDMRPAFTAYIRKTFGARARSLGWKVRRKDSDEIRLLRPVLLELVAGEGEDPALSAQAVALARRWLDDRKAVEPDIIDEVLVVAARNGDQALFDRMHAVAKASSDRKERVRLLEAMGSFRTAEIARAALAVVLTSEFDMREASTIYKTVLEERTTRAVGYEFIKQNFAAISKRLPRSSRPKLVAAVGVLCDREQRADVEAFFAGREQSPRAMAQALEKIDLCVAQVDAHRPSLRAFLEGKPNDLTPGRGARKTRSGLYHKVITKGTGAVRPKAASKVKVHYTGWTTDGAMFDSSVQRGQPAIFPLDAVIPGWTEGVQLMVVGEKRRLWIPEDLAYKGKPGRPAGMLVFDVELLEILD